MDYAIEKAVSPFLTTFASSPSPNQPAGAPGDWAAWLAESRMSEPAAGLAESGPSDAGQKGPKRLFDDKDFWKIYEKGETIGRGHFAKVKLVRHRSRRDSQPATRAAQPHHRN